MNLAAESIGLLGGAFGLTIAIPQTFRVIHTKSHVGVSAASWLIQTLMVVSWATFGFRIESPSQIISNLIAAIFNGLLTWILLRDVLSSRMRYSGLGTTSTLIALSVVCVAIVWFSPEPLMNAFLAVFLLSRLPQLASSFKSWRLGRSTVVSISTYALSTISGVCWVIYGILMDMPFVILFTGTVTVFSLLVMILELGAAGKAARRASA